MGLQAYVILANMHLIRHKYGTATSDATYWKDGAVAAKVTLFLRDTH